VGSPQCSLLDVPGVDPRATDAARAELRAGRVLCSACQRTPDLFPTGAPVVVTAPAHHFPQPVIDHWTREDAARYPVTNADRAAGMPLIGHHWAFEDRDDDEEDTGDSIQEAEERDTSVPVGCVHDADDDNEPDDCAHCCGCPDYQGCDTGRAATCGKE
jgi:hypothetical protein